MGDGTLSNILVDLLGILSMASSLIIPLMYYYHPKTRQHPNMFHIHKFFRILVMICLAELSISYHTMMFQQTQQVFKFFKRIANLPIMQDQELFQIILQNSEDQYYQKFTCLISFQSNLYIVWCVDFVLTMRAPLSKTKFRILFYIPLTICMVYIQCFQNYTYVNTIIFLSQFTVSVVAIIICFSAIRKAQKIRNKFIGDLKIKFLLQQAFSTCLVVIMIGIYTIVMFIPILFQDGSFKSLSTLQQWVIIHIHYLRSYIFIQGIILGLIRLQEKYFREQLFKSACYILRIKNNVEISDIEQPDQFQNVPLSILIKTIQSQQVMNGILEGIINSIQSYEKLTDFNKRKIQNILIKELSNNKEDQNQSHELSEKFFLKSFLKDESIDIKVVEYEPGVFTILREIDSISISDIEESLSVLKNSTVIDQMSESMGKSGSIFFRNYNKKFLIKTLTKNELDFLIKILPSYESYIKENRNSLIARIYGCYVIQIENISPVYLILMEYTLEKINEPFQSYDIKGSSIGRRTNSHVFGKDLDFLDQQELINLNMKFRKLLIKQVKKDSKFLNGLNIMDYSLLIGISKLESNILNKQFDPLLQTARLFPDLLNDKIYSTSIIDYLQSYDTEKYIENRYKSIFNQESLISSVPPDLYSKRFVSFLNSIICASKYY